MNEEESIRELTGKAERVRASQNRLDEELLALGRQLDGLMEDADSVNTRLKKLKSQAGTSRPKSPEEKIPDSEDGFTRQLEELLRGSLQHLEERLSQRIVDMLKEVKETAGPLREAKIKEIRAAVDAQNVDLSRLFIHEKVESNINEIGVEEKEAQGIDRNIEKLRKMKKG